jgi:outer membrane protein TolC
MSTLHFRCIYLSILSCALFGCASYSETALKERVVERQFVTRSFEERTQPEQSSPEPTNAPSARTDSAVVGAVGDVHKYVALAMEESPELRAAFERWRASVSRISRSRRMPEPTLSFGYYIRAVETRVGPQRARIGLSQTFPWPTRLTASADAASATARSAESEFDALALRVRSQVAIAYYRLWLIRQRRKIHGEHLEVLRSLSETILARVATGGATLSEQQQVDLSAARLEDRLAGMDEQEVAAKAQLRAIIGTRAPSQFPTDSPPAEAFLPRETEDTLALAALRHPSLESFDHRATAQEQTARALRAEGLPSFSVGADWIITGPASMPDVPDSGKDAVIVGGGVSLPLWGRYGESAEAARADAQSSRSLRVAGEDRALAELQTTLSAIRDAVRRVGLLEHTLVPQAESAYASILGSYVSSQGTVAQALLVQKELLDLREELESARAEYSIAWANLEQIVGHSVEPRSSEELPLASATERNERSKNANGESPNNPMTPVEGASNEDQK